MPLDELHCDPEVQKHPTDFLFTAAQCNSNQPVCSQSKAHLTLKAPTLNTEQKQAVLLPGHCRIIVKTYDKYFFPSPHNLVYGEYQQFHKEGSTSLNHWDKYAINFWIHFLNLHGLWESLPHYGSRCSKSQSGWDQRPARQSETGSLARCFSSFSLSYSH